MIWQTLKRNWKTHGTWNRKQDKRMTKKDKHMIKNATPHMMDQYIGHFALFKLPPPIPLNLDPPDLDPLISPLTWACISKFQALYNSGMTAVVIAQTENQDSSSEEETSIVEHFLLPQCQTPWCAHSMPCHTYESPVFLCTVFAENSQRKILSL